MRWFRPQRLWHALSAGRDEFVSQEIMQACTEKIDAVLGPPPMKPRMYALEDGMISWADTRQIPEQEVIPLEEIAEIVVVQFDLSNLLGISHSQLELVA